MTSPKSQRLDCVCLSPFAAQTQRNPTAAPALQPRRAGVLYLVRTDTGTPPPSPLIGRADAESQGKLAGPSAPHAKGHTTFWMTQAVLLEDVRFGFCLLLRKGWHCQAGRSQSGRWIVWPAVCVMMYGARFTRVSRPDSPSRNGNSMVCVAPSLRKTLDTGA